MQKHAVLKHQALARECERQAQLVGQHCRADLDRKGLPEVSKTNTPGRAVAREWLGSIGVPRRASTSRKSALAACTQYCRQATWALPTNPAALANPTDSNLCHSCRQSVEFATRSSTVFNQQVYCARV